MSDQTATNLDDLQADIDERADAEIRASIAAGAPVNAWVLAGEMAAWWQQAGVDCRERPRWHREQARQCQARIDELRREVAPAPAAPAQHEKFPLDADGLVRGVPHIRGALAESAIDGSPLCRLPNSMEWIDCRRRTRGRQRLLYAVEHGCRTPNGDPWLLKEDSGREERIVVEAAARAEPVHAKSDEVRIGFVHEWAGKAPLQYYTYSDVWESAGLKDTTRGASNISKSDIALIRYALEMIGWSYGDARIGNRKHAERWKNPGYVVKGEPRRAARRKRRAA